MRLPIGEFVTTTSGAQIAAINDDYVIKIGDERVTWQGAWIASQTTSALPLVPLHWDGGYVMQRLWPIDHATVDIHGLVSTLQHSFWNHPSDATFGIGFYGHYVWDRCRESGLSGIWPKLCQWLTRVADTIKAEPTCCIHGDATLDNTMMTNARGGRIVFIDPIRSPMCLPLMLCDAANLAQSLHGYEHLKYGTPMPNATPRDLEQMLELSDERADALRFFTAVKFARLMFYETTLRPVFTDVLCRLLKEGNI